MQILDESLKALAESRGLAMQVPGASVFAITRSDGGMKIINLDESTKVSEFNFSQSKE